MAQGFNGTDDIKSFVNTIWEEAVLVARDRSILPDLVHGFNDRAGTALRTRSDYGTVTYSQVADTDDLTSQVFKPTAGQSLTPYKYGGQFFITDLRVDTDPFAVQQEARQELGAGAAQKVQRDIAALFSSLTGGTVGSAGGTLVWRNIFAAQAILQQNLVPGPYFCVLQPGQCYYLGTVLQPGAQVTPNGGLEEALMNSEFFVGRAYGTYFFHCADIVSGTAAVGAMFGRDALAYDLRRAFRIEPQRDASRDGWELNATMVYAAGIWRPTFGVQMVGTSVVS